MNNNYDKIANYYDGLSRVIFFKSQVNAQVNQLKFIEPNSTILIVGGGTGWLLTEIGKLKIAGLKIVYVEISVKMIALAQKRDIHNIEFIHLPIENFQSEISFDIIVTPFLFDNFDKEKAAFVYQKLNVMLKPKGLWFFTDFQLINRKGRWWKWIILKTMYIFFKIFANVEADRLVDMAPYFWADKYTRIDDKYYYGQFIKATIYKKSD